MPPETWIVLGAGLAAGAVHAASGPDHLAGVAPFAARGGARAWRVGFAWGLGHALGALLGALAVLALRSVLPDLGAELPSVSERLVGVLLCIVGALGLHAALRARIHAHPHAHPNGEEGGAPGHAHLHLHGFGAAQREHRHPHAAFALGALHGAAGLAHLFAVLPALALPGHVLPGLYLGGYALASLATLTAFAMLVGWTLPADRPRRARAGMLVASAASLAVGLVWLVRPL
jgi:hypothetical protein